MVDPIVAEVTNGFNAPGVFFTSGKPEMVEACAVEKRKEKRVSAIANSYLLGFITISWFLSVDK